jgi:hypothetical protein
MKILSRLPLSETHSHLAVPDGVAEVKPFQIAVMVSLSARNVLELDPGAPRFPAVLDTGHNHTFAIRREHLVRWGRTVGTERGRIRVGGERVPLLAATVWIHPNVPGTAEVADRPAYPLELKEGIAVYPPDVANPARLPILGLRAIVLNNLKLIIDGKRREVTLKTAGWI